MANDERPTTDRCLLYYITDRTAFAADEPTRRRRVLEKIAEAAHTGVDYIQLREKDLTTQELESLSREAVQAVREARNLAPWPLTPVLLVNSRTDVALTAGADGVQLRSDDISPKDVRDIWTACGADLARSGVEGAPASELAPKSPIIGVSCRSQDEVAAAQEKGATFAVFAPIFEKKDIIGTPPAGLGQLREACRIPIPVFALGGITLANARFCLEAGAAGIAAIRLFQENDVATVVDRLRQLAR